jgi:predicted SAM-dependent methyltransferase
MGVSRIAKNYKFKNLNWWINLESGNVQINPKVSLEKLYAKSHGSGTTGKVWKDHHNLFYKLVKPFMRGNICEIGGGNNSVLSKIKNFSKIQTFYSFDKNLKLKKNNKKIIKIKKFFNKDFFEKNSNLKFDLIIHSHTFEHLYKPDEFLKIIRSISSKKGKHIFTMPNMKVMIKKAYANAMNFEHPYFFDENLVDALLVNNDFKILKKIFYKEDHSIMYVTKISNQNKRIKYLNYNENLKLFKKMFKFWKNDISKINKKINNSNSVFIFGAHIFSQMMLFNGLNKINLIGILDNDKNKIENYLYGTKFKIHSPYVLKKIKNPSVILRAGSYNDEIKKQLLKINPKTSII